MANTIRIKRRITGNAGAPGTLAVGELAYNEMDDILYIGKYNNNSPIVAALAGAGEFVRLSNVNQTIAGVKTFSSHPIISETQLATSENSTKIATTAWVKSLNYTTTGVTNLSFGTHNGTSLELLSSTGTDVTLPSATTSLAGLLSATDKTKLDGIGSGASVTSVGLSLPAIFTVTNSPVTTSGTLTATLASQTANQFFAAPNGSAGAPTFRAIVAADIPTLNQNTTGTASNVTGTVAIANGGTGATTAPNARTNLGATTVGSNLFTLTNPSAVTFPRFNADNTVSTLTAADFRTAISAGTVTGVTATSPVASSGGTAPVISLSSGYGDTQNPYASKTANFFLAAPNGTAGVPTFRAMVEADVPSLTASKISNFDTQVRTSRLDQMAAPTADVGMNNRKITGLATPVNANDAATKEYVDAATMGIHTHLAARVATTGVLPFSPTYANGTNGVGATLTATTNGALTVDGVTVAIDNRILVKDQASGFQNGIYVVTATGGASAAYVLTRAADMNTDTEFPASFVFVEEGTVNADNGFICTTNNPVTVGTTSIDFTQFSGAGQISAGAGLTKTGNTIDVVGTVNRITVNANDIDIASTYVGQTSITTLGTITTGTWNGSTITVARGGTGATTLTSNGIVYGNGTSAVGVTAAGTWDSTNSIGQLLSHNSSGVPVWTDNIDGGTF